MGGEDSGGAVLIVLLVVDQACLRSYSAVTSLGGFKGILVELLLCIFVSS